MLVLTFLYARLALLRLAGSVAWWCSGSTHALRHARTTSASGIGEILFFVDRRMCDTAFFVQHIDVCYIILNTRPRPWCRHR